MREHEYSELRRAVETDGRRETKSLKSFVLAAPLAVMLDSAPSMDVYIGTYEHYTEVPLRLG